MANEGNESKAHRLNADFVNRFVQLCEKTTDAAGSEPIWYQIAQEVRLSENLQTTNTTTWCLRSKALLSLQPGMSNPIELLPLPAAFDKGAADFSVKVSSVIGERSLMPVSHASIHEVMRDVNSGTHQIHRMAVPMSYAEYTSSPTIQMTVTNRNESPSRSRLLWRHLLPVAHVKLSFQAATPIAPIRVSLPESTIHDGSLIVCRFYWAEIQNELATFISKATDQLHTADPATHAGVARILMAATQNIKTRIVGQVTQINDAAKGSVEKSAFAHRSSVLPWSKVTRKLKAKRSEELIKAMLQGVDNVKGSVDEWATEASGFLQDGEVRLQETIEIAEALDSVLPTESEFAVFAAGEADGEFSFRETDALKAGQAHLFRLKAMIIPFTSQNDPGYQMKRATLLLGLLAITLMLTSLVDLSWVSSSEDKAVASSAESASAPSVDRDNDSLRSPLVTLLLVFPIALYSQFFQARPTSPFGRRAQDATFAILSLMFAAPVIPAALLAAGIPLSAASVVIAAIGLLTAIATVLTWLGYRDSALEWLRMLEMRKGFQATRAVTRHDET